MAQLVNNNSEYYRDPLHSPSAPNNAEEAYQAFAATVLSVDWEREVVSLVDLRTNSVLVDVNILPCVANSGESTDVTMPEEGSTYLCLPVQYTKGYMRVALVTPILTDTVRAKDAIGYRLLDKTPVYNIPRSAIRIYVLRLHRKEGRWLGQVFTGFEPRLAQHSSSSMDADDRTTSDIHRLRVDLSRLCEPP